MGEWNDLPLVKRLWTAVNRGTRYSFRTGPAAQRRLRDILNDLPRNFFERHPEQLNLPLRKQLAPSLRAGDQRELLALWIIRDWGHIYSKNDPQTARKWMAALDDFQSGHIEKFVSTNGTCRVSSWSKLLAFADHKSQAIYDARTSVTLNCTLRTLRDSRRFYMPSGRNSDIDVARRILSAEIGDSVLGYTDYIKLLFTVVKCKLSPSILAAEMVLFANAPSVARSFIADFRRTTNAP